MKKNEQKKTNYLKKQQKRKKKRHTNAQNDRELKKKRKKEETTVPHQKPYILFPQTRQAHVWTCHLAPTNKIYFQGVNKVKKLER